MRTRKGNSYPKFDSNKHNHNSLTTTTTFDVFPPFEELDVIGPPFEDHGIPTISDWSSDNNIPRKRARSSPEFPAGNDSQRDCFDQLPDDIVILILCKLSSAASCPADFISVIITCKRFNGLALNPTVLSKASPKTFAVKARNWSESADLFLKRCSDAGNVNASYILGMIRFYCFQDRGNGASLMAKAAINSHAAALYSLAIIQFNGTGGKKSDKDLRAGVALCARAAFLGHIDALRELGHCLQDGYGVRQNVPEGRRFLIQANARELAAALVCSTTKTNTTTLLNHPLTGGCRTGNPVMMSCPLLSDFGCNVPMGEINPANQFLVEWFSGRSRIGPPGLRMCSHMGCGRRESRRHEFRRCSVCGDVNYCSRACQALDWKLRHKLKCIPMERWVDGGDDEINGVFNEDGVS